ncbi:uncharacterized protein EI97DRAFT_460215 [Westerdykella ornata]|uniref:Uncharacterized protein n=1 Tax=Westerdykella ornata TaxID=318751 RepID=A0A6A6JD44_WESOR|nr:uncharacterized protein EI97DRAFT_460215 [Westerdykella ornata]KAF2274352.1 hypothetical protein EI97DRAFT_460215 [Westerdykella ornata]
MAQTNSGLVYRGGDEAHGTKASDILATLRDHTAVVRMLIGPDVLLSQVSGYAGTTVYHVSDSTEVSVANFGAGEFKFHYHIGLTDLARGVAFHASGRWDLGELAMVGEWHATGEMITQTAMARSENPGFRAAMEQEMSTKYAAAHQRWLRLICPREQIEEDEEAKIAAAQSQLPKRGFFQRLKKITALLKKKRNALGSLWI